jgi:hypothetical protein
MTLWPVALVGGVVAITVVQVAAYYYLLGGRRATTDGQDGDSGGPGRVSRVEPAPSGDGTETDRARRCPDCGAPNGTDTVYTFCHRCGAQLS